MERKRIILLLRWIAVLPGATLAALVSLIPLHIGLYQVLVGSGLLEQYPEAPERLLGPLVVTFAFIWAGSNIAPRQKVATAAVLFGLMLFCVGSSLALALSGARVGNLQYSLQMGGLPPLAGAVGAFLGLYLARQEELDRES